MIKKVPFCIMLALAMLALFGCAAQEEPEPTAASQSAPAEPTAAPSAQTSEAAAPGAEGYYSFDYDGTERKYLLYVPGGIEKGAPLVAVLHGYTGDAPGMMKDTRMNAAADKYGFAVVYPEGLPGRYEDANCWNADLTITDTDDLGFLVALVEYLQQAYGLSAGETFATGFSNGGFMCYKLACDAPDVFRAVASVSGTMSAKTWEGRDKSVAVPILQIHGTGDNTVPVDGTMSSGGGWGGAPAISEIISYWTDADDAHDLETTEVNDKTTAYRYSGKENDNLVWYYEIEGYPHQWPKEEDAGFNAEDVIWEFFSNYVE